MEDKTISEGTKTGTRHRAKQVQIESIMNRNKIICMRGSELMAVLDVEK